MEKTMTFDEWWRENRGEFNRITAQSKRKMRIAFEAGQQSQQAKVDELQKRVDAALYLINNFEGNSFDADCLCEHLNAVEQALKGEG